MIRHKIYMEDVQNPLVGSLELTYKDGSIERISDTAVSVGDAEGLCVLRCFGSGVAKCSFLLCDGTLVALAENI